MLIYLARRLALAVITCAAISVLTFVIIRLPPGDFVDAQGRLKRILEAVPSEPGSNIYLTIDAAVQQAATKTGAVGDAGAVFIFDAPSAGLVTTLGNPAPVGPAAWNSTIYPSAARFLSRSAR